MELGLFAVFWMFGAGATLVIMPPRKKGDLMGDLALLLAVWPIFAGIRIARRVNKRATQKRGDDDG